jgi:mannonate dehydratase
MNRRNFIEMGAGTALATQVTGAEIPGNQWSAKGLKLGVSHQRPEMLTDDHLKYLKQMGVEYLEVRINSALASVDYLTGIKRKLEDCGLKLFEVMLSDKYSSKEFCLGLPGRDKEIVFFQNFLRDLGKAGIDATTYAWNTGGEFYATGRATTRDCETRRFELRNVRQTPAQVEQSYSEEEMWANYEYFIKRVLPVAEDVGVRLQLHPNDPPVDNGGVARIFKSRAAFRRAMEIGNYSPYSGLLFCVGSWAEMAGPEGKGEDVLGAIEEFGARGLIFQVHYRNVTAPLPVFDETFPDNGYINMYKVVRALAKVNYNGMLVPDHVPRCGADAIANRAGEAFIFGYIRAMIQAVETEMGWRT